MAGAPKEGDVIAGKYRVDRVLGEGGMGVVVAAWHADLEQKVAIKVLNETALKNAALVQRFEREARAAVKIQSRHVARVVDVGKLDDGTHFMVMEFLEGRDLSQLMKNGSLGITEAVDLVLQACDAISEAHAYGIVHRDIKPANLFLAEQGDGAVELKVLDFGISKSMGPDHDTGGKGLTKTTDVFGSPMYMSPEQLLSTAKVDHRTDLWALGIILYELVGGHPPFHSGSVAEIWSAILERPVPVPSLLRGDLPRELEEIIMRCLTRDVEQRYQTVGDLAEDLAPWGSGEHKACIDRAKRFRDKAQLTTGKIAGSPLSVGAPATRTPVNAKGDPNDPNGSTAPTHLYPEGMAPVASKSGSASRSGPVSRNPPGSRSGALTTTDWQSVVPKKSHGGFIAGTLIFLVLAGVAGTAYYVRTHLGVASPLPAAAPTEVESVAAPPPPEPTASAEPVAVEPTSAPTAITTNTTPGGRPRGKLPVASGKPVATDTPTAPATSAPTAAMTAAPTAAPVPPPSPPPANPPPDVPAEAN